MTDCPEMTQFKQETVRLFNEKNRHGAFGYSFLCLAGNQVREQEKFKNNEAIQKLEMTYRWAKRTAVNFNLFHTARKSDKKFFTPTEEENIRQGLKLKLAGVRPDTIINCDESPVYRNLTSSLALRDKDHGYKLEISKTNLELFFKKAKLELHPKPETKMIN